MAASQKRGVVSDDCLDYEIQTNDIPFCCKTCGQTNASESVWVISHTQKRIYQDKHRCRGCRNRKRNSYPVSHEEKKEQHLKRKFGMTLSDYYVLLAAQDGRCPGCNAREVDRPEGSRKWPVDHDHETGEVRGILCVLCNAALGQARDSIPTLLRLADYLARSTA